MTMYYFFQKRWISSVARAARHKIKKIKFTTLHNTVATPFTVNSTTLFSSTTTSLDRRIATVRFNFSHWLGIYLVFFMVSHFSLFYNYHNHQNPPNATTMAKYSPPSIFAATSLHNITRICKRVYFWRRSQICHAFGRRGKSCIIFDGRKYQKIVPMALTSNAANSP